jgi:tetratricopeptide (TPR) repeat protein
MDRVQRVALALASTSLLGVAAPIEFSTQQLALLDPTASISALCGGGGKTATMRDRLAMAAAIVQAQPAAGIRLYDGLGKINFPVSTSSAEVQRYFNQGMGFAYGFNHAAAIASFREAQRLDPNCAMCFWGEALAHGPNINAPITPDANAQALKASARAVELAANVKPAERALIMALTKRYSADPNAKRADLDGAYADAMLMVARYYPSHDDIGLLAAEAAMDTLPWNYWDEAKRNPQPRLGEAIGLVEAVLARNPDHPQAPHLYIHLMENGPDPKRAEAAADRLSAPMAADAGHMVHMPAHIYYRLGRWKDSIRVNIDAARKDEAYIKEADDKGFVRYGYYPHNVHFIVTSAQMGGDLPTAIREAKRLASIVDANTASQIAWIQAIYAAPYYATLQFAPASDVLELPEPDPRLGYVQGVRHYVRAVAYAQQKNEIGFDKEMRELARIRQLEALKAMADQGMPAPDILGIAEHVARGKYASIRGRHLQAADHYRQAVAIEDRISYMEPPWWYFPVHQSLGSALYRAGRYQEAQQAFTAALAKFPNNGWALYGLAATEQKLGRRAQAAAATAALNRAWMGDPKWLRMERI